MNCCICGKEIKSSLYMHAPLCSEECFTTHFWDEKVQWQIDGDITENDEWTARIDGTHYVLHPDLGIMRGFGGRRFIIHFTSGPHEGYTIVTHNLWCQGKIEEPFVSLLPDNAVFWEKLP